MTTQVGRRNERRLTARYGNASANLIRCGLCQGIQLQGVQGFLCAADGRKLQHCRCQQVRRGDEAVKPSLKERRTAP